MKPLPVWVEPLLLKFGKAPNGRSRYRVIWSEDRIDEDEQGIREYRYGRDLNRWILEQWFDGDYEHSQTIEIDGQYVSLETFGADTLALLVRCIEQSKLVPKSEKLRVKREAMLKQQEEDSKRFSEIYDEAQGPFGENAVSGIPSKRRPDDVRLFTPEDLPAHIRRQLASKPGSIRQIN